MSRAPMSVTAPAGHRDRAALARHRSLDVAAGLGGEVDEHRPGLHRGDHGRGHEPRRGAPGNGGGRDDDVGCRDVRREQLLLSARAVFGELLRVAAARFGRAEVEVDERAADRADLVGGCRAHVVGRDDAAEPLGRRDRLQARDARAEHEHARGSEGSGGGHRHAEHAPERVGGERHEPVAGEQRLRRQHVHRLRARDARQQVERERGDRRRRAPPRPRRRSGTGRAMPTVTVPAGSAAISAAVSGRTWKRMPRVERLRRGATMLRPGRLVGGIRDQRARTGARLDLDGRAGGDELLDAVGGRGDALLTRRTLGAHAHVDRHCILTCRVTAAAFWNGSIVPT